MKNVTLIVHASIKQSLADLIRGHGMVKEFTFTSVEGHGAQDERDPMLSVRDRVVGYTPHVRVDILIEDDNVAPVLDAVRRHEGIRGRGVYWVTAAETFGRL